MELYKQPNSKYWTADFFVDGRRVRKSTKQTNRSRAQEVAGQMKDQVRRREEPRRVGPSPKLREFMTATFTPVIASSTLSDSSKAYYRSGWKVLSAMVLEDGRRLEDIRLDCITTEFADGLALPGSGSNQNMALRTLRRALSMALEKKQITIAPRIKLRKERQRTAVWDAASEANFLRSAKGILRDVFIMIQDSGMRPEEVLCLRARDVLWDKNLIYVLEGKTKRSTRHVPLSERMPPILVRRSKVTWNEYLFPAKKQDGLHDSQCGRQALSPPEKEVGPRFRTGALQLPPHVCE